VEWHTVAVIPWVLRRYWNDPRTWLEKLPEVRVALQHVALHYAQVGEGLQRLREVAEALGVSSQGGAPALDRPPPPEWMSERPRRPRMQSERLKRRRRKLQRDGVLASSAWLLEMREMVRATGREAVFVFPPAYQPLRLPKRALEGDDRLRVLDYLDPQRYPALYQASSRGFTSHLNPQGAAIWSRMLARDLSPVPSPPH
jgi:hypothetical protein